ncbi:MAG: DUF952 domain-containing protein [Micromonosporaceae bacterium]|nr:DUF952 domain-containing protein [Micromonosporaceae bacterium]
MGQPIYHLVPYSIWGRFAPRDLYTPQSLDSHGFVHFSGDEATLLAVANAYYHDATEPMAVLIVDPDRLSAKVRWEPPSEPSEDQLFPHVYGPIERSAVIDVRVARRDAGGRYSSVTARPPTAKALDLIPHPEGGWYRETWASPVRVSPPGYEGERASATAILFLLRPGEESRWHRVRSDELWLWHSGGPLQLRLGGAGDMPVQERTAVLGGPAAQPPQSAAESLQALVPANTWQAARPAGDDEVLVSCVVSPGFEFADFQMAP